MEWPRRYWHAVLYSFDQFMNVVFRPLLVRIGVIAAGWQDETITSALGKSHSPEYVKPEEACKWCGYFCVLLTWIENLIKFVSGRDDYTDDHCAKGIERDEGMPPLDRRE